MRPLSIICMRTLIVSIGWMVACAAERARPPASTSFVGRGAGAVATAASVAWVAVVATGVTPRSLRRAERFTLREPAGAAAPLLVVSWTATMLSVEWML